MMKNISKLNSTHLGLRLAPLVLEELQRVAIIPDYQVTCQTQCNINNNISLVSVVHNVIDSYEDMSSLGLIERLT